MNDWRREPVRRRFGEEVELEAAPSLANVLLRGGGFALGGCGVSVGTDVIGESAGKGSALESVGLDIVVVRLAREGGFREARFDRAERQKLSSLLAGHSCPFYCEVEVARHYSRSGFQEDASSAQAAAQRYLYGQIEFVRAGCTAWG